MTGSGRRSKINKINKTHNRCLLDFFGGFSFSVWNGRLSHHALGGSRWVVYMFWRQRCTPGIPREEPNGGPGKGEGEG